MPSIVLFLPSAILFLAALVIVLFRQFRPGVGYAWLISALGALLATFAALFLRWWLPLQVSAESWRLFGDTSSPLVFVLDFVSWPYVLSLSVLALAFILTDSARLETEARPFNWMIGLVLTGIMLLAVMAGNLITLISVWTTVDLLELTVVISSPASRRMSQQTITLFGIRVLSTVLAILAILLARSQGIEATFLPIPQSLALVLLLATGLRLGVLPLNVPYIREVYPWRGLSNVVRMLGPASALVALGRMPVLVAPAEWQPLLMNLTALGAFYGGVMFLTAPDELNGRPHWFIALAGLAIACVLNGQAQASIAWGSALILVGSVLFLYSAQRRSSLVFAIIAMLTISGLPFTPAAAGWRGLVGEGFRVSTVVFILVVVFLEWGFLRHFLRKREELYRMERWVHTVYPVGLAALLLTQWVLSSIGIRAFLTVGVWPVSVTMAVVAAAGIAAALYLRSALAQGAVAFRWVQWVFVRVGGVLGAIFRMNWLYGLLRWIYRRLQNGFEMLTLLLEGDGGVLWTLVLLALLVSLILAGSPAAGGVP